MLAGRAALDRPNGDYRSIGVFGRAMLPADWPDAWASSAACRHARNSARLATNYATVFYPLPGRCVNIMPCFYAAAPDIGAERLQRATEMTSREGQLGQPGCAINVSCVCRSG